MSRSLQEPSSAPTRSCRRSARAGWARCTGRATRSWTGTSRSRCCRKSVAARSRRARAVRARGEGGGRARRTRTSWRSTTSARTTAMAYAVMELLEGETLRGSSSRGPIPPKQAVDYALQIAKGLSAAHEKGIVHRDLKPENLFVTKDGHVKILDFGLAKREERSRRKRRRASRPLEHTEPGTVMGTMGYMSPEQVRGLPVDHRSDIFSFGAILYEMLSGKKAFKRDTASDTMAAILQDEPPELAESGRDISPGLDQHRSALPGEGPRQPLPVRQGHRLRAFGGVLADVCERRSDSWSGRRPASEGLSSPLRRRDRSPRGRGRLSLRGRPHREAPARSRRQAGGGTAVREPRRCRRRLLRRRDRRRDPQQADVAAGSRGDRARQLDALQEDDEDSQADRAGARTSGTS